MSNQNLNEPEVSEMKQEIKTLNVFGCEIKANSCSCLNVGVFDKVLNTHVADRVRGNSETFSLTQMEIMKRYEEATAVSVDAISEPTKDYKYVLRIETTTHTFFVHIPEVM